MGREELLLLGRDHGRYGELELRTLAGGLVACALSTGSDSDSPSRRFKGDPDRLNEDGLLVLCDGDRTLLAVADAHFGCAASHDLLALLRARATALPATPAELGELVAGCVVGDDGDGSASTLLIAVHDRAGGRGFGLSFGDSGAMVVRRQRLPQWINQKNDHFVSPRRPPSLAVERGSGFAFRCGRGELLLAFTDGVDECHYNRPESSVRPAHMAELFGQVGAVAAPYARRLAELALAGVGGNPGGQDNLALIVVA